ncbi:G-protein coupled receptor-associated protein LMBRD2-like isoform X2 [Tubulanus polymorphus]|uniref:G-protein coupled receptor-associated protein LMBRD2-like isoform X2 n=1 Tax=Tubulanus polymorphus TaxID=672921 RepID=UPI003DA4650F
MSVAPLVVEILLVGSLAAFLLNRYGNWRKQHVIVTLATFIAWYFSFMIIFILPLDVSSTYYHQCVKEHQMPVTITTTLAPSLNSSSDLKSHPSNSTFTPNHQNVSQNTGMSTTIPMPCKKPWSYVEPHILPVLWRIVYWTSQLLTWIVLPMMQSYASAGDFTVAGKLKSSLIENAIYYGTYLIIFGICLIYVAARPDLNLDGPKLKVIGITASNTWGLCLLVLLLGYALVEVPRMCWENSKKGKRLEKTQFKVSKLSTEKSEAEENLEDVLDEVKRAVVSIRSGNPLRPHVETILSKCPESVQQYALKRLSDPEERNNPTETPTVKSLVRLHKRVIRAIRDHHRTQCQWEMLMEQAFRLQDVVANENNADRKFKRNPGNEGIFYRYCYNPTIGMLIILHHCLVLNRYRYFNIENGFISEWYWRCRIEPWVMKLLSGFLIIVSIMVVWSECTFFCPKPVLSIFANFVYLAKRNYDYFTVEVTCCLTVAYISICAYFTIFKIRVLNYFQLVSRHQTDENSLIFSGMLLCRLTPPMCLNFLGLIHLDSHITKSQDLVETAYTRIMGHMDVIPFIANGFNIYFPIAILLLCLATYFYLGSRVLHFLGFQQFVGDDDMTQDLIDEGREFINREKRRQERKEDRETRRQQWHERFGGDCRDDQESDSDATKQMKRVNHNSPRHTFTSPKHLSRFEANDRISLLNSEPVDFNDEDDSLFDMTLNSRDGSGRYQSRNLGNGQNRKPPKGIFDDV